MVHYDGTQGRLKMPGQPGGLCVPQRLAPGGAQLAGGGEHGAGQHRAGQDEAEFGRGGPARGGVQVAQPPHARPDQVAEPPAEGGGVHRQRQPGQPDRGQHRPSGGQVGEDAQQRRPGGPPGPGQHPRAQGAGAGRVGQQHKRNSHRARPSPDSGAAPSSASRSSAASCGLIWSTKCASAVRRSLLVASASFISAAVYPDREPVGS